MRQPAFCGVDGRQPEMVLLEFQNTVLEMIATGETLDRTIARLCLEVETLLPDVICSVMAVNRSNDLYPLFGSITLPSALTSALNSIASSAHNDVSHAKLAHRIAAAGLANPLAGDAAPPPEHTPGLEAWWSSPILDSQSAKIGTFTLFYRTERGAGRLERLLVRHSVRLCAIAIERDRRVVEHQRRAFTDELTGLPNRAAFNAALTKLRCDVPGAWALFVIDLDNLKMVNDTFGHHAGDCLLQLASDRIASVIQPRQPFRIGGDEFAVIIESPDDLKDLDRSADHMLAALAAPAPCGDHILSLHATIGGAVLSSGDRIAERVRQHADFALYHAKETGRGGFVRYWPGLGTNITRRLSAIRDVDAALRDDRIDVFYQPIVRLGTNHIVGLEALARMRIGEQIVPAANFHDATTDVHIATALTARMMRLVAADVRKWLDMGIPFQHVGINVSSADLHGGTLGGLLAEVFDGMSVPLKHVIVEVTESVYLGDGDGVVQREINELRARGLRVALDDFGTGFASLTHLMTVPVDIIKIDKSFVDRLAPGDASMAIVEGLIGIARRMDVRVVAEGIENEDQARQLQEIGCTLGQGYLFSRAVDRHATTALLLGCAQQADAFG